MEFQLVRFNVFIKGFGDVWCKGPFTLHVCVCICFKLQYCVDGMLRQMQRIGLTQIILKNA